MNAGPRLFQTPPPNDSVFDEQLQREINRTNSLRSLIVAGIMSAMIITIFIGVSTGPADNLVNRPFHEVKFAYWLAALISAIVLYELLVWYWLRRKTLATRLSQLLPYLTSCIEISMPSCFFFLGSQLANPAYIVTGPPLLLYGLFILLTGLYINSRLSIFAGLLAGLQYLYITHALIDATVGDPSQIDLYDLGPHKGKAILLVCTGIAAGYITRAIKNNLLASFQAQSEKQYVLDVFGQHVSPRVVDELFSQGGGEGVMRRVCVMFLDIRGFTTIAEHQAPQETVQYLNRVFTEMIAIVNRHEGVINKFLGDGFMAVFGPPFSEQNPNQAAINASLEIIGHLDTIIAAGDLPATRVGIGLHTGDALTGNIGSEQRREYTVIGDVVNLASRIEQLNKEYGSQLLASKTTWNESEQSATAIREIGDVNVKGREEAIALYQLA